MTGGLLIKSGNPAAVIDAGLLLEVVGVGSGRHLHAQDLLSSSGRGRKIHHEVHEAHEENGSVTHSAL